MGTAEMSRIVKYRFQNSNETGFFFIERHLTFGGGGCHRKSHLGRRGADNDLKVRHRVFEPPLTGG